MSDPTLPPVHCCQVAPWITEAMERMYREYQAASVGGCTCPDVDVSDLRGGERSFSRTVKGLAADCPEHGAPDVQERGQTP